MAEAGTGLAGLGIATHGPSDISSAKQARESRDLRRLRDYGSFVEKKQTANVKKKNSEIALKVFEEISQEYDKGADGGFHVKNLKKEGDQAYYFGALELGKVSDEMAEKIDDLFYLLEKNDGEILFSKDDESSKQLSDFVFNMARLNADEEDVGEPQYEIRERARGLVDKVIDHFAFKRSKFKFDPVQIQSLKDLAYGASGNNLGGIHDAFRNLKLLDTYDPLSGNFKLGRKIRSAFKGAFGTKFSQFVEGTSQRVLQQTFKMEDFIDSVDDYDAFRKSVFNLNSEIFESFDIVISDRITSLRDSKGKSLDFNEKVAERLDKLKALYHKVYVGSPNDDEEARLEAANELAAFMMEEGQSAAKTAEVERTAKTLVKGINGSRNSDIPVSFSVSSKLLGLKSKAELLVEELQDTLPLIRDIKRKSDDELVGYVETKLAEKDKTVYKLNLPNRDTEIFETEQALNARLDDIQDALSAIKLIELENLKGADDTKLPVKDLANLQSKADTLPEGITVQEHDGKLRDSFVTEETESDSKFSYRLAYKDFMIDSKEWNTLKAEIATEKASDTSKAKYAAILEKASLDNKLTELKSKFENGHFDSSTLPSAKKFNVDREKEVDQKDVKNYIIERLGSKFSRGFTFKPCKLVNKSEFKDNEKLTHNEWNSLFETGDGDPITVTREELNDWYINGRVSDSNKERKAAFDLWIKHSKAQENDKSYLEDLKDEVFSAFTIQDKLLSIDGIDINNLRSDLLRHVDQNPENAKELIDELAPEDKVFMVHLSKHDYNRIERPGKSEFIAKMVQDIKTNSVAIKKDLKQQQRIYARAHKFMHSAIIKSKPVIGSTIIHQLTQVFDPDNEDHLEALLDRFELDQRKSLENEWRAKQLNRSRILNSFYPGEIDKLVGTNTYLSSVKNLVAELFTGSFDDVNSSKQELTRLLESLRSSGLSYGVINKIEEAARMSESSNEEIHEKALRESKQVKAMAEILKAIYENNKVREALTDSTKVTNTELANKLNNVMKLGGNLKTGTTNEKFMTLSNLISKFDKDSQESQDTKISEQLESIKTGDNLYTSKKEDSRTASGRISKLYKGFALGIRNLLAELSVSKSFEKTAFTTLQKNASARKTEDDKEAMLSYHLSNVLKDLTSGTAAEMDSDVQESDSINFSEESSNTNEPSTANLI